MYYREHITHSRAHRDKRWLELKEEPRRRIDEYTRFDGADFKTQIGAKYGQPFMAISCVEYVDAHGLSSHIRRPQPKDMWNGAPGKELPAYDPCLKRDVYRLDYIGRYLWSAEYISYRENLINSQLSKPAAWTAQPERADEIEEKKALGRAEREALRIKKRELRAERRAIKEGIRISEARRREEYDKRKREFSWFKPEHRTDPAYREFMARDIEQFKHLMTMNDHAGTHVMSALCEIKEFCPMEYLTGIFPESYSVIRRIFGLPFVLSNLIQVRQHPESGEIWYGSKDAPIPDFLDHHQK